MMRSLTSAVLAILIGSNVCAQPLAETIDKTTQFLLKDWLTDPEFKDFRPPQVITINATAKVYGGCGEFIQGDEVGGSSYCPPTHTIFLAPEQLEVFQEAFGPSSVAYIVAHEFSHAIQNRYGNLKGGAEVELQADCIAGVLIDTGSQELNITREGAIQMAQAAYSIGDPTHGTGAQRAYALLSGMGVADAGCSKKEMLALLNDEVNDPAYKQLLVTRSGTGSIDLKATPYPKPLGSVVKGIR